MQARAVERLTLPECHRLVVAAEKERFEKLEAALSKQMRELESQAARDLVRFEAELAKAWETSKQADERAERRVQDELTKVGGDIWLATGLLLSMSHSAVVSIDRARAGRHRRPTSRVACVRDANQCTIR